ncbi:NB-ARC domain-containing disease resistance protein [Zostera marina]|uniref:NB-ARC domain-containing disease resistance protein n=1 Tax=Zostera marina TaxID=29655 RepID=A0A0K9PJ67_ZOSMR|nr:NB-ARC domain-containing disease resistance protein [Zostera marina]
MNTMKQDKERLDYRCKRFNAVLNDAEDNWEIYKISTKRWLHRLKLCISDAENVIEEYNYEYIQAKEDTRSITSISDSFSSYISDKLKEMHNKFEEILEERRENYEHMDEEDGSKLPQYVRLLSSPLSDQSIIYGRDDDLKKIVEILIDSHQQRQEEEEDYTTSIIVLVGIGGVGKTTLAQTKITKDTLVSTSTKKSSEEWEEKPSNLTVFSVIQEKLLDEWEGKKFLLVLDDVWNEIHEFSDMLGFLRTLGVQGSKIVVTTRSKVVANTMNPSVPYNLVALNSDDAWKLFRSRAIFGSSFDYEKQLLLEDIGKKIVEKYKGLPLIIKMWKEMMEHNPMDENEILECLRLSYTNLSAKLKRCFLYCSIYPKDHVFVGDELIRLWVAQGILRDEPEDEYIYVNGLLYRTFLEKHEQLDDNWGKSKYTLHDIMHDLAHKILEEEHSLLSENKGNARFEPIHGRTFHRSLYPQPKDIKIERLHTHLKHLRNLTWADETLVYLPDSIGELIHLRYLCLDTPSLVSLPESVCRLYNLRTIQCDSLKELPINVRILRELRHIISSKYIHLSIGLAKLIHLQTLPKLKVSSEDKEYSGLEELKNLSMLRGSLVLQGLVNEYVNEEDKMLKLYQKPDLRHLELTWFYSGENQTSRVDVLNNLKPHFNLVLN